MKTDKVKEVLTRLVAKSHGLPVDDLPDNASLLSPSLDIDQAAHQLNQMLIEARLDELREAAFHLDDWDEYAVKRNQALKAEKDNHADQ